MPRPKKPRFVSGYPAIAAFVPQGMPITGEVMLTVEELEAIRLSDFERLDQESAAEGQMSVMLAVPGDVPARGTFSRSRPGRSKESRL